MDQATLAKPWSRRLLLGAIAALGITYTGAVAWLGGAEGMSTQASGTQVTNAAALDVPPGMEQTLAKKIGALVPQMDELFVFPAADNNGFTVSMTLDYVGDEAPSTQQIKHDMNLIFPAAYSSSEPVEDVEVYVTFNGEIIAGAEMGDAAYKSLAAETSSQGSLADALEHAKMVTVEGPDTSWMQVEETVPGSGSGT